MTQKNNGKMVLLGMSGGVDSSVAALLLKKQGYKVVGAFMKNFSETKNRFTGECAWVEERKMAQRITAILRIPFITLDFEKEYKKEVIEPMFRDYASGKTPNPDILCNRVIKFPLLWKEAQKIGADFIATGHYARIRKTGKGFELLAGKDKGKDQSYFLAELGQGDLEHTLFPVGNLTKLQVREIARRHKFPNFDKRGSRGICFVGKINMQSFLKQKIREKKGRILNSKGEVIGEHPGVMYYTIGQRIGPRLGLVLFGAREKSLVMSRCIAKTPPFKAELASRASKSPQTNPAFQGGVNGKGFLMKSSISPGNHKTEDEKSFVVNSGNRKLYVGEKRGNAIVAVEKGSLLLKRKEVKIKKIHLINPVEKIPLSGLRARIRHLGVLNKGKLVMRGGRYYFRFDKSLEAVAKGQFIVIYNRERVIASGEMRT